jgi:hypothetical protein
MITFKYEGADTTVETTTTDHACWDGLIDTFINFLRGCGYVFTQEEIVDYASRRLGEIEEVERG